MSHDLSAEDGNIRSISEGDVFVPQQGWQYYDSSYFDVYNFDKCLTERSILLFLYIDKVERNHNFYFTYTICKSSTNKLPPGVHQGQPLLPNHHNFT